MRALSDVDERARAIEQVYEDRFVPFANALAAVTGRYESGRDAAQEGFPVRSGNGGSSAETDRSRPGSSGSRSGRRSS
jgi:glutaminase